MLTLSKIAKLANVSLSTASKAFSMSSEVNEDTREAIFKVAREYGCFKRYFNAKYPRYVIAVICPEFHSLYYARCMSMLQQQLGELNCEVCVASTGFDQTVAKNLVDYYYKYSSVDGIIAVDVTFPMTENIEIPIVHIKSSPKDAAPNCICNDNIVAFTDAIDYLVDKNISDIGFIGELKTKGKYKLFQHIMALKNIPVNESYVKMSDKRFEKGGYDAMQNCIDNNTVPRAIICAYDYMAIGAIKCATDNGLRVPEDVAIMGIDNIPEAEYLNPPLASVSMHTKTICTLASGAIIKQINGEPTEKQIVINSDFILRKSFEI